MGSMGTAYNSVQSPHPWAHSRGPSVWAISGTLEGTPKIYIQKQLRFKHKMPITDRLPWPEACLG